MYLRIGLALIVATLGMSAWRAETLLPLSEQKEEKPLQYEFQRDLKPWVALHHGGTFVLGHLDAAGNFVPRPRMLPLKDNLPYSGPGYTDLNVPKKPNELVYEYRSGALIKGTLSKVGNFVPEVKSKVIALKDYTYSKDAPRIYNLPGRFVKKDDGRGKR